MKKSIAILALVFVTATSFAQYNNRSRDYSQNRNYGVNNNNNYGNLRNVEISRIEREYAFSVQRIESDRFLSRRQKRTMIRAAENRKNQEILMCNNRFKSNNNQARRNDNNYDRRYNR